MYDDEDVEVSSYIKIKNKSTLVVKIGDNIFGKKTLTVKISDVIQYYAVEARNITSGCRTLAGFTSDWRPIDGLAKECLEVFKQINIEKLRREGQKRGMTLR